MDLVKKNEKITKEASIGAYLKQTIYKAVS